MTSVYAKEDMDDNTSPVMNIYHYHCMSVNQFNDKCNALEKGFDRIPDYIRQSK